MVDCAGGPYDGETGPPAGLLRSGKLAEHAMRSGPFSLWPQTQKARKPGDGLPPWRRPAHGCVLCDSSPEGRLSRVNLTAGEPPQQVRPAGRSVAVPSGRVVSVARQGFLPRGQDRPIMAAHPATGAIRHGLIDLRQAICSEILGLAINARTLLRVGASPGSAGTPRRRPVPSYPARQRGRASEPPGGPVCPAPGGRSPRHRGCRARRWGRSGP